MPRAGKHKSKQTEGALPSLPLGAVDAALFALFSAYIFWWVSPPLRYSDSAPAFLLDARFFYRFTGYPGGLLQYAGSFVAQLDCYAWLGAAAATGFAWGATLLSRDLLRRAGRGVLQAAAWIPALLLLLLHNSYSFPVAPVAAGLLLSLATVWCYAALLGRWRAQARLLGCWAVASAIFYVAGSWWFVFVVVLCALIEFFVTRQKSLATGCVAAVLLLPVWRAGFPSAPIEAGDLPDGGWPRLVFFALLAALPTVILAGGIADCGLRRKPPSRGGDSADASSSGSERGSRQPRLVRVRLPAVFSGIAAVLAIWATMDPDHRARLQVGYYAGRGDWAEAVSAAGRVQSPDYLSTIELVRALSHVGRLPEDLFSFRLPEPFDLFPGLSRGFDSCVVQAQALLELGQVNLAEHFAHEALELKGERPDLLLLIARINAAKDRPRAARIFLNALRKVPFHRAEAEEALRCLDGQGQFPSNWEIASIRTRMPISDDPSGTIASEEALRLLLQANGRNRQALDYMMTYWLLTAQFDKIRQNIPKLVEAGYTALPKPCEEALLLTENPRGASGTDPQGFRVQERTAEKYRRFLALRERGESAREMLNREFAGSYWLFGLARENRLGRSEP